MEDDDVTPMRRLGLDTLREAQRWPWPDGALYYCDSCGSPLDTITTPCPSCGHTPELDAAQRRDLHELVLAAARHAKRLDADVDGVALTDGWEHPLTPHHPLAPLMTQLARVFVAHGFTIHDCAGKAATGGVCLTPAASTANPWGTGVVVTWTQHDAAEDLPHQPALQDLMNDVLHDVLVAVGYAVEDYGQGGANLVTGIAAQHQLEPEGSDGTP